MNEVTTKVAKSLEQLRDLLSNSGFDFDATTEMRILEVIDLLQSALDKLCEETK